MSSVGKPSPFVEKKTLGIEFSPPRDSPVTNIANETLENSTPSSFSQKVFMPVSPTLKQRIKKKAHHLARKIFYQKDSSSTHKDDNAISKSPFSEGELNEEMVRNLSDKQIRSLTPADFEKIYANKLLQKIPSEKILLFTEELINNVQKEQLAFLNTSELENISPCDLKILSPKILSLFTSKQMQKLTLEQIASLTESQVKALGVDQHTNYLDVSRLHQLDAQRIRNLPTRILTMLSEEQLQSFDKEKILALTSNQIEMLHKQNKLQRLNVKILQDLTTEAISEMHPLLLQRFSKEQLADFSKEKILNLSLVQQRALSEAQLKCLPIEELQEFDAGEVEKISPRLIRLMSPEQLDYCWEWALQELSTEQLLGMDNKQLKVIFTKLSGYTFVNDKIQRILYEIPEMMTVKALNFNELTENKLKEFSPLEVLSISNHMLMFDQVKLEIVKNILLKSIKSSEVPNKQEQSLLIIVSAILALKNLDENEQTLMLPTVVYESSQNSSPSQVQRDFIRKRSMEFVVERNKRIIKEAEYGSGILDESYQEVKKYFISVSKEKKLSSQAVDNISKNYRQFLLQTGVPPLMMAINRGYNETIQSNDLIGIPNIIENLVFIGGAEQEESVLEVFNDGFDMAMTYSKITHVTDALNVEQPLASINLGFRYMFRQGALSRGALSSEGITEIDDQECVISAFILSYEIL